MTAVRGRLGAPDRPLRTENGMEATHPDRARQASTPHSIVMVNLTNIVRGEGGALHQLGLAKRFAERGHRVIVLAPRRADAGAVPPDVADLVRFTPSLSRWRLPLSVDGVLQIPGVVLARLRGYRILYIRANLFSALTVLVGRGLGMYVLSEHNGWAAAEGVERGGSAAAAALQRFGQIWCARLSTRSRCVTQGIADLLARGGVSRNRLVTIGNGCDTRFFTPRDRAEACRSMALPADPIRIGFIGGLVPWQGVETAVRGLCHLPPATPDGRAIELAIAGDGPDRMRLEAVATQLNLAARVRFLGYVPRDRAPDAIGCFDIAVAPFTRRRNEEIGLSPIKIRDYAACGRPVVASGVPGIAELAGEGWLWAHRPDDEEDFARTIQALLEDAGQRDAAGVRARRYAEAHFDWNVIADRIADALFPQSRASSLPRER